MTKKNIYTLYNYLYRDIYIYLVKSEFIGL